MVELILKLIQFVKNNCIDLQIRYYRMQANKNPIGVTNSQFAQVQAFQKEILDIFRKEYKEIADKEEFYTNIIAITRFSVARQLKKEKIIEMWRGWIKWYEDYRPDKISESEEIISKVHTSGKYRYCGFDKAGNPVLVIRMRYHIKGLATATQNLRYLLYMIQKGVKLAQQSKTYQLSVIYDRREMAQSDDVSKESMKQFMPILNDCYPETLKSFYVLGANFFYRAMWKIVSIFVSKRTEDKINLLQESKDLTKFIDVNNLDSEYGGTLQIENVGRVIHLNQK